VPAAKAAWMALSRRRTLSRGRAGRGPAGVTKGRRRALSPCGNCIAPLQALSAVLLPTRPSLVA
jgi:hypothetical protein